MKKDTPDVELGKRLRALRLEAGFATQKELAIRMNVRQQTVSRWEDGTSKPRKKDLDLLGKLLAIKEGDLVLGETSQASPATVSFDRPFPVDSLSSESFERFCDSFLSLLYPMADVHRFGGAGHKQHGLDIEAIMPNGEVHTFQCKRHSEFGAAKVNAAVRAHTRHADRKFLLLARTASDQARTEMAKHPGWELWDKEDIAKRIRTLPRTEQIRLVDIYFPGQRIPLLGETEAGPWMTVQDFYAAFLDKQRAFNHLWHLVGREAELANLVSNISTVAVRITFLSGSGGIGKSKLLYQALVEYEKSRPSVLIKVLSSTEELSTKHLDNLGTGEKLLVVDDAHEREDLPTLLAFAANPNNRARIVLSLRSYGYERLSLQVANASLSPDFTAHVSLKQLTIQHATELAAQVIREFGGDETLAAAIAGFTRDCPLAIVVAAQIVSKEKISPYLLANEDHFRNTLLARFQKVITGEIAPGRDQLKLTAILRILALVQPFSPDDRSLPTLIEKAEQISLADSNRMIKALVNGGVVFKRGSMYRLAPDLLADYIIEESCVTVNGSSSGYAERIFECAPSSYIEHILVNLGKLDWRRSNGDTASSRLLDGMWQKLRPTENRGDTHLKAITSVAFYQPARALEYARQCIQENRIPRQLPDLIRHAAYNFAFMPEACAYLWELGRLDERQLNQYPQHPIRILKELCAVAPNKPVQYNEQVVEFALSLLNLDEVWEGAYTPYDILRGILETEGHTTTSNGREFTLSHYLVRQKAVSILRSRVIDEAVARLDSVNTIAAIKSANVLSDALRYPMGSVGANVADDERSLWTSEFVLTIEKINRKATESKIDPYVWIEILKAVSRHAKYAQGPTHVVAKIVYASAPTNLEFRAIRAFVDGYGHLVEDLQIELRQQEWQRIIQGLATELTDEFSDPKELHAFVRSVLKSIETHKIRQNASPSVLLYALFRTAPELATQFVESALSDCESPTIQYLHMAMPVVYELDISVGKSLTQKMLNSNLPQLREAVARGMGPILKACELDVDELSRLKGLLSSNDELEVALSVDAIRYVADISPPTALGLILSTNFCQSERVADEVLGLLNSPNELSIDSLDRDSIQIILDKLLRLPSLEKYWVETFVAAASEKFPIETLNFFKERVEFAVSGGDYSFRPCNYGPYVHTPLRFNTSYATEPLHKDIWNWMRGRSDGVRGFQHFASQLFSAVFSPFDENVMSFLREKFAGDSLDIALIGKVLCDAPQGFAVDNPVFINGYLTAAKSHGGECLKNATNSLYSASISGTWSSSPGEPAPVHVEARKKASAILDELSRASPGYHFFDLIKRDAERNIADSIREREQFEE